METMVPFLLFMRRRSAGKNGDTVWRAEHTSASSSLHHGFGRCLFTRLAPAAIRRVDTSWIKARSIREENSNRHGLRSTRSRLISRRRIVQAKNGVNTGTADVL